MSERNRNMSRQAPGNTAQAPRPSAAPGNAGARPAGRHAPGVASRSAQGAAPRPAARHAQGSGTRPAQNAEAHSVRIGEVRPPWETVTRPPWETVTRPAQNTRAYPAQGSGARPAQGSGVRPAQGNSARPAQGSGVRPAANTARVHNNKKETNPSAAVFAELKRIFTEDKGYTKWIILGVAALVLILLIILLASGGKNDEVVTSSAMTSTVEPEATIAEITPEPTATVEPTPSPVPNLNAANAVYRPEPSEGGLPIFTGSSTSEKIIAITVDDCFQADNLAQIVDLAITHNGKITIFPIGQQALREKQAQILKYAWENGMEIENHTYTHNGLYRDDNETFAKEIVYQSLALNKVLGVDYTVHFLRPKGGDARRDQRMHVYADHLGYYGIAHWNYSGSNSSVQGLQDSLKPGMLYLFHTTDKDLHNLQAFIPYATSQGYRLVTMNEMFGYPENEYKELTGPVDPETAVIPPVPSYERNYATLKKTTYSYAARELQEALLTLGYLEGEPDGVYGKDCETAIKKFQSDHNLEVNGVANAELQRMIFEKANIVNT